jgi:hypothetical protein
LPRPAAESYGKETNGLKNIFRRRGIHIKLLGIGKHCPSDGKTLLLAA